jgi:hypothetical protein
VAPPDLSALLLTAPAACFAPTMDGRDDDDEPDVDERDEAVHALVDLEAAVDADDLRWGELGTDLAGRSSPRSDSLGLSTGDMFRTALLPLG